MVYSVPRTRTRVQRSKDNGWFSCSSTIDCNVQVACWFFSRPSIVIITKKLSHTVVNRRARVRTHSYRAESTFAVQRITRTKCFYLECLLCTYSPPRFNRDDERRSARLCLVYCRVDGFMTRRREWFIDCGERGTHAQRRRTNERR